MARKAWSPKTEITPELLKSREKRKWQIALRRYVLERNPCVFYAPYFGLDIENLRHWFESQFGNDLTWEDFGKKWQFDHIIPVTHFDFSEEQDLKLCWNFTNLRVDTIKAGKEGENKLDILAAKRYFNELYVKTGFELCKTMLGRIEKIETAEGINSDAQGAFIMGNEEYLKVIRDYTSFEFELLNRGRSIEEVKKEMELLKKHAP